MQSERRYSARHALDLPVYIRYRKRRFLGARARAISVGGMFLEVRSLTLPNGTLIDLEFSRLGKDWRVPAIVIHGSGRGLGVMFREPQPTLFQEMLSTADAALPPPAAGTPAKPLTR
jgi:hypothetical protein